MYLNQRYLLHSIRQVGGLLSHLPTLVLPVDSPACLSVYPRPHTHTHTPQPQKRCYHSLVRPPSFPMPLALRRVFLYIYVIRRSSFPPGLLHVNELPSFLPHGAAPRQATTTLIVYTSLVSRYPYSCLPTIYTHSPLRNSIHHTLSSLQEAVSCRRPASHRPLKFIGAEGINRPVSDSLPDKHVEPLTPAGANNPRRQYIISSLPPPPPSRLDPSSRPLCILRFL